MKLDLTIFLHEALRKTTIFWKQSSPFINRQVVLKSDLTIFLHEALRKTTIFWKQSSPFIIRQVVLKSDLTNFLQEALHQNTISEIVKSVHPFGLYNIKKD